MKEYDSLETVPSQPASTSAHILGSFSIVTGFLVTIFLVVGMIVDHNKVTTALVGGLLFFTLYVAMVLGFLSGQLSSILINRQREVTIRRRDVMQHSLYLLPPAPPSVELVPLISLPPLPESRFVPAVPSAEEGVKIAAYDFVYNLYKDGALDETRVLAEESKSPGQIQFKKPRGEVVEYLLALGMVRIGENKMLFFNTASYPTLVEAKRAIKHGTPPIRRD